MHIPERFEAIPLLVLSFACFLWGYAYLVADSVSLGATALGLALIGVLSLVSIRVTNWSIRNIS